MTSVGQIEGLALEGVYTTPRAHGSKDILQITSEFFSGTISACMKSGGIILSSYQAARGAAQECSEQGLTKPKWITALPERATC